jgi:hypothetical protein
MSDGHWYYLNDCDEAVGPVSPTALLGLMRRGEISPETLVCEEGFSSWVAFDHAFNIPTPDPVVPSTEIQQAPISSPLPIAKPVANGCVKGCGGCLAVGIGFIIICIIIGAFSDNPTPPTASTPDSESEALPALDRLHKEAPYATYEQGYDSAKRTGLTGDVEPLINAYRKMGYSEEFISGFRDGVFSNGSRQ